MDRTSYMPDTFCQQHSPRNSGDCITEGFTSLADICQAPGAGEVIRRDQDGLAFAVDPNDWELTFLQCNSEVTIDSDRSHYVHTDDMDDAVDALDTHGRVVLCGPPGSGKTSLGHALLRRYRRRGFKPYVITHVHDWHAHIGEGRRSVVLMDGTLGVEMLDRREYQQWRAILRNINSLNLSGDCLMVLTVYPHILRELRRLDSGVDCHLLNSAIMVHLMRDPLDEEIKREMLTVHLKELHLNTPEQDALVTEILQKDVSGAAFPWCCRQLVLRLMSAIDPSDPLDRGELLFSQPYDATDIFTAPSESLVPFLQQMFSDKDHGETMAAVMSLTMLGLGHFLHNPRRVQPQLAKLGFRDFSDYRLDLYADSFKGSFLKQSGADFRNRITYDAVGLALGRSFSLPIMLEVCDVMFLVQHVRTKETATEFSVTIGPSPDDHQLLMQTMYEHMVSGLLPELCQHPSLHCPQFLQEFDAFCRANKNDVQRLVSAVDTVHRKPLLYWSVWGPTGNLTQWCLKLTEGDIKYIVRGGWLAQVLLACKLVRKATDEEDNSLVTLLATLMSAKKVRNMIQTEIDLPLPSTEQYTPRSCRAKMDQVMSTIHTNSLCYLDDPSLPIPNKLVSMEVRSSYDGDKVHVVVPSKQWYLALRLLADRQVDERDEEGNTLLHVAADTGDLDVVKIAVKSGASLTARNNKGQNPPQLAANRKARGRKCRLYVLESWLADILWQMCRDNRIDAVKRFLCTIISVNDRSEYGRTLLHWASEVGQTQIAALLISLEADVNATDVRMSTPLHLACRSGKTEVARLLISNQADLSMKNNEGCTPLSVALQFSRTETVSFLQA